MNVSKQYDFFVFLLYNFNHRCIQCFSFFYKVNLTKTCTGQRERLQITVKIGGVGKMSQNRLKDKAKNNLSKMWPGHILDVLWDSPCYKPWLTWATSSSPMHKKFTAVYWEFDKTENNVWDEHLCISGLIYIIPIAPDSKAWGHVNACQRNSVIVFGFSFSKLIR